MRPYTFRFQGTTVTVCEHEAHKSYGKGEFPGDLWPIGQLAYSRWLEATGNEFSDDEFDSFRMFSEQLH